MKEMYPNGEEPMEEVMDMDMDEQKEMAVKAVTERFDNPDAESLNEIIDGAIADLEAMKQDVSIEPVIGGLGGNPGLALPGEDE